MTSHVTVTSQSFFSYNLFTVARLRRGHFTAAKTKINLVRTKQSNHMGCKHSKVIPVSSVDTSRMSLRNRGKEEEHAMARLKSASEDDPETVITLTQTKAKVLQQLTENDTLKKSYIGTGGVAYNISLNDDNDSMLVTPACPKHIVRRMERPTVSHFSPEEKELISDIMRKEELSSKGEAARMIAEKQEKAKQRREERQQMLIEKFERKSTEERLRKLEEKRKERLNQLTDGILGN